MVRITLATLALATVVLSDPPRTSSAATAAEEVSEIYVTGLRLPAGVPTVPRDSVGSRDVFGPVEVRETGAREINDLVQNIPAISTRPYNGGEASAPSFSMRGLPDDGLTEYIHVLIDGVPASRLPYGWTAFSFMPITTERIHAIDYIRGAHSVRYSPNTVGGVLNLITAPIPGGSVAEVRNTFGAYGYRSTLISVGGTRGRIGAIGTFVDKGGDGYRDNGSWDQQDAHLKLRWDIDGSTWLAGSFGYIEDDHQVPGGLTQAEFDANRFANSRPGNHFDGYRANGDVVWHRDFDDGCWAEGFLYFSDTYGNLHGQRPPVGTSTTIEDRNGHNIFGGLGGRGGTQVEFLGMQHSLYGGVRVQRESIPSQKTWSMPIAGGPTTLLADSDLSLTALSLHLDDTFHPTERWTVVLGARVEWVPTMEGSDSVTGFLFEDDELVLLPGVGVSYEACRQVTLFANYFEGFRAPQVWGFGSTAPGEDLKFEKGRSAELGARYFGGRGVTLSVTGWRLEFDDFGVFYTGTYSNLGRILSLGVDFEAEWQLGEVWASLEGLALIASFTVQDAELKAGPSAGNEVPYAWEQKAAWRLRYARNGWSATVGGTYVGDSFSDEANTSAPSADGQFGINPSRAIWDARVARRIDLGKQAELNLAVGATNLFDKDWYVHSRGGFFGGGLVSGAPFQGYASFDLSVKW